MEVYYTDNALKQLEKLEHDDRKRIIEKVISYASRNAPLKFAKHLTDAATFRFRVGDYRVIVEILHGTLWVLSVKRRDEAYR